MAWTIVPWVMVLIVGGSARNCRLTESGNKCQFPFILWDEDVPKRYIECTTDYDDQRKPWCSIKTFPNDTHVKGSWGYCGEDCTEQDPRRESQIISVPEDPSVQGTWLPDVDAKEPCGVSFNSDYIIGGQAAGPGQFPYMALLGYWKTDRIIYACGGTLINRRYVVTAAHCQGSRPAKVIREVLLGETVVGQNIDCPGCEPALKYPIQPKDVILHQNWNPSRFQDGEDIALIRLPELVPIGLRFPPIRPICLPWKVGVSNPNSSYTISGWGRTGNDPLSKATIKENRVITTALQYATVSWLDFDECQKIEIFSSLRRGRHICVGGKIGVDSCSGDSGGPLIAHNKFRLPSEGIAYLRGIVSYGTQDCGIGYPGIYTNIDHYIPWITKNLQP